ncbi:MAG: histidinol dehydrogenase [Vicinamibacteria bacterium]|nr:histidinol dehydrogenase [Vicinamibacteria bacterium]
MTMRILRYGESEWRRYLERLPRSSSRSLRVERAVQTIIRDVRRDGDRALVRLTARLDGIRLDSKRIHVSSEEIRARARRADPKLAAALGRMARNIERYHRRQIERGFSLRLPDGSTLVERITPIDAAGLYVPGGAAAYPSSVLMNAVPARVAGVPRIEVVTPPRALDTNPAIAAALVIVGLEGSVYRIGGAQAVAALAYGTASVPAVSKIVGPGNAYVTEAKRQVRGTVDIDQEAGPSEVVILADETADAGWAAVDLLAQAEHGSGSEIVALVTPARKLAIEVKRLVDEGARSVANVATTRKALARQGAIVLVRDLDAAVEACNLLAPEHAEVMTRDAESIAKRIIAGAVFVGHWTPVSVGDYGVGPNHVLPTGGTARFTSALSVRDFVRRQSQVKLTRAGLRRVASDVARVAEAEGLTGHAQSVLTRFAE